ncbi:MAG: DUF4393 domain-containing protein [Burkholderiaceae bacterium]
MSAGWLEVVREGLKVPGLLVEVYGDLARPGVRQVGLALETVLGLGNTLLWPVALANERARIALVKNLQAYRERMVNVPEKDVIQVAPEIGVPIAEKLAYVNDIGLTSLYVELLAKASTVTSVAKAHPSFVNVINNLSPDEALLLQVFMSRDHLPFARVDLIHGDTGQGYQVLKDVVIPENVAQTLAYPENVSAYFSNLAGLGLVQLDHDGQLKDEPQYAELESLWLKQLEGSAPPNSNKKVSATRGTIDVTAFGRQFISACHEA